MSEYSVAVEADGPPVGAAEPYLDALVEALHRLKRADTAVVSWGGPAGGPGIRFLIRARDPMDAAQKATQEFEKAVAEAGLATVAIQRVEIMTERYQDAWLSEPPEEHVGLSEIAGLLGVSKQRVFELRERPDFPRPLAELAAGPVWKRSSLNHFIAGWDRTPGRRKKTA
jgi:hypothetical protein